MSNAAIVNSGNSKPDEQILFRREVESFRSRVDNLSLWCNSLRQLGEREYLDELLAIESAGGELVALVASALARLSALTAEQALEHEQLQSFNNDCTQACSLLRRMRPASETCESRASHGAKDILPFAEEDEPAIKQDLMNVFGCVTWLDASTEALNDYAYLQGTVVYQAGLSVLRMMEVSVCETFKRALQRSSQRARA